MSFLRPGCSCPIGFRRLFYQGPIDVCGLGSQRRILTSTVPCALNSAFVETMTLLWVRRLEILGANPNPKPNPTPNRDPPPNLSMPRSLTLQLSRLLAWALTPALEGDHETGVASALVTSLDRTQTLAKALPSWGPNTNL